MQTFLPYANFSMTAKVLDRSRLGKQRVEAVQILTALKRGEFTCPDCGQQVTHFNEFKTGYHCYHCEAPLKRTAWYNHPATKMWKGYETCLMLYLREMCMEWVSRGYEDTRWQAALDLGYKPPGEFGCFAPEWLGNERFHLSHQSNLLRKNPEHYGQYFLGVPDDLPYVWPTKELVLA